jgi:hypothetical protein
MHLNFQCIYFFYTRYYLFQVCQLNGIPLVYLGHEKSADEGNGVYVDNVEVG